MMLLSCFFLVIGQLFIACCVFFVNVVLLLDKFCYNIGRKNKYYEKNINNVIGCNASCICWYDNKC